jgi:hypothetical protein
MTVMTTICVGSCSNTTSTKLWCEGNYQTYAAQRRQRLGEEAERPHRSRYKKLTRL